MCEEKPWGNPATTHIIHTLLFIAQFSHFQFSAHCPATHSIALALQMLFVGIVAAADMVVYYQPKILLAYSAATCIT